MKINWYVPGEPTGPVGQYPRGKFVEDVGWPTEWPLPVPGDDVCLELGEFKVSARSWDAISCSLTVVLEA